VTGRLEAKVALITARSSSSTAAPSWSDVAGCDTASVARKRLQLRPPGLKPTTKVGTLGPYRGRLGAAWVIAPLVAGVVILIAGALLLFR
jgi:hypothetical protein